MDYEQILKEQMGNVIEPGQAEAISDEAARLSEGLTDKFTLHDIMEAAIDGKSIFNSNELIDGLKTLMIYEVRAALVLGVEILIICIVTGLLKNLSSSFGKKSVSDISMLVCTMIIIGISINSFRLAYNLAIDSVTTMVNTMEILTPVLLGILISTGSIASGTIMSPLMIGTVTGTGIILKKIILPAMFAASILALINCLTEKDYVNKLSRLIRNTSVAVTGLVMALLSGIISVQGLITDASDGLLINTAKYSLSTFIPIVGGFTADTAELFIKCMSTIKNIVGVFGIITLVLVILVPIIKLLIIALIYKITAAAAEPICDSKISDTLNDMGSCIVSMGAVMFFASLLFIIFIGVIVGMGGG